jgi:hypothetical protein
MTRILSDSMAIHHCTGWGNSNELYLRRLWSGYHAERPWPAVCGQVGALHGSPCRLEGRRNARKQTRAIQWRERFSVHWLS